MTSADPARTEAMRPAAVGRPGPTAALLTPRTEPEPTHPQQPHGEQPPYGKPPAQPGQPGAHGQPTKPHQQPQQPHQQPYTPGPGVYGAAAPAGEQQPPPGSPASPAIVRPRMKAPVWAIALGAVVLVLCCGGAAFVALGGVYPTGPKLRPASGNGTGWFPCSL